MANGSYEIDEQTFRSMPIDKQNWMLYVTFNEQRTVCDGRFVQLEKRKWLDTPKQYVGGAIAAILVITAFLQWVIPIFVDFAN